MDVLDTLRERLRARDAHRQALGHPFGPGMTHALEMLRERMRERQARTLPATISVSPSPALGLNPGPFRYEVVDIGGGMVQLRREGRGYGPRMPAASVRHFVNDLEGRVDLPLSGRPEIDAVIAGKAEPLGKGDDGIAFRVGPMVVKVSTTVPYHPENSPHRSPEEAAEMLRGATEIHNRIAAAGVECIDPAEYVRHDDKGFQIKPYVPMPERWTRASLDRLQDCVIATHRAGIAIRDQIQAGVGDAGRPVMFDVGKAAEIEPNDAGRGHFSRVESDMENLAHLYGEQGQPFVRKDRDVPEEHWREILKLVPKWRPRPERHEHAATRIQEVAEERRERARALLGGPELAQRLATIDADERNALATLAMR